MGQVGRVKERELWAGWEKGWAEKKKNVFCFLKNTNELILV
jgi:hypothetical protein